MRWRATRVTSYTTALTCAACTGSRTSVLIAASKDRSGKGSADAEAWWMQGWYGHRPGAPSLSRVRIAGAMALSLTSISLAPTPVSHRAHTPLLWLQPTSSTESSCTAGAHAVLLHPRGAFWSDVILSHLI